MSDLLVDGVTVFSFIDHFGEKSLFKLNIIVFSIFYLARKKGLMTCSGKQMDLLSTLLIYSGVLVLYSVSK